MRDAARRAMFILRRAPGVPRMIAIIADAADMMMPFHYYVAARWLLPLLITLIFADVFPPFLFFIIDAAAMMPTCHADI